MSNLNIAEIVEETRRKDNSLIMQMAKKKARKAFELRGFRD
jgi:hypothetical protein